MAWWDASGAFALYGVVAGGAITVGVTALTNGHSSKLAEDDREERAKQAVLDRQHAVDSDIRRSATSARQAVYPKVAEQAQQMVKGLSTTAVEILKGNLEPDPWILDTPDRRKMWSEIEVFGSERTCELWSDYKREVFAVDDKIKNLALRKRSNPVTAEDWDQLHTLTTEIPEDVDGLIEMQNVLFKAMREDLVNRPQG